VERDGGKGKGGRGEDLEGGGLTRAFLAGGVVVWCCLFLRMVVWQPFTDCWR
jgi:hypothetical protein